MRESKKSEGGGAFKAPPPPDRIGLKIHTKTHYNTFFENLLSSGFFQKLHCLLVYVTVVFFLVFFLTYIYLSKHKYNKTYKVPYKTTQDEKYVQK